MLIIKDIDEKSVKINNAIEKEITIISIEDFQKMI